MAVLPESKYDLSTYWGRLKHCAKMSSPLTLFNSNGTIRKAQKTIEDYKEDKIPLGPEVWKAKQLVESSVHPDTGEIVVLPFRMSSCVLSNLVVTAGMLSPGLGPAGTVFWQWMNQSLNVAVNAANANKSDPLSTTMLITNYFLAVAGSCGVALGLGALVPRLKNIRPATRTILGRLIPFAAVVTAGQLNLFLMRSQEIKKGITVFDADSGENLGKSKTAAWRAVAETGVSRAVNATPIMVIPPLILYKLQQGPLKRASMKTLTVANLGLIAATSFIILPMALAIFPQKREVDGSKLEPEFRGHRVQFNRGI